MRRVANLYIHETRVQQKLHAAAQQEFLKNDRQHVVIEHPRVSSWIGLVGRDGLEFLQVGHDLVEHFPLPTRLAAE